MRKIIAEIIRKHSTILTRDYIEINSLISGNSLNLNKFINSSIKKTSELIYGDLLKIFPFFSFVVNGSTLNPEKNSEFRIILNIVDGFSLFENGISMFSVSAAIQNFENKTSEYKTKSAIIFLPIQNEMFFSDDDFSLMLNNISMKKNNSNFNKKESNRIFSTRNFRYLLDKNSFICNNSNLGLVMLACGKFDYFLDLDIGSELQIESGLFIARKSGASLKLKEYKHKEQNKYCLYSGNLDIDFILKHID